MGSPLGAAVAYMFVTFQEKKLFEITDKLFYYLRYIDDTFAIFSTRVERRRFFHSLNHLHPPLKFTCE